MLYVFGFERIGVVVGDIYFVDPDPVKGQEGAEHGVRLELRVIERGESRGSIYSATPITVDRPVWRADLLQAVGGRPFDRTHHHPAFTGWNPTPRVFTDEQLHGITVPTLALIAGRSVIHDPQRAYERARRLVPAVLWLDATHAISGEHADRVNQTVLAFIDGIDASQAV